MPKTKSEIANEMNQINKKKEEIINELEKKLAEVKKKKPTVQDRIYVDALYARSRVLNAKFELLIVELLQAKD